ncbi:MAG: hypothetical protein J6039_02555 [Alphaproteobacteria bacterium]|nr:hypothetical protein [Alphaproteobacteria bacterium]
MLHLYHINKILEWKIPNDTDFHDYSMTLSARFHHFYQLVTSQFGPYGLLILGLFVFFLVLIAIIYIKSVADTFRAGKEEETSPETPPDGLFYTIDTIDTSTANDNLPVEKPMPEKSGQSEISEKKEKKNNREAAISEMEKEISKNILAASSVAKQKIDPEKQKSKMKRLMRVQARKEGKILTKLLQKFEPAASMISLIINMIARNVTDKKIAQSLFLHYKDTYDEEDLLHTIKSVRDVVGLYNSGKFDYLPEKNNLPPVFDAVFSWANDDYSKVLLFLQSLLNLYIKQADDEDGIIKDMTYALAANCSCIIGNVARFKDMELAHNSFELATELAPKNVIAWNRLGDVYMSEKTPEKAMIAYQNVLDIADKILYESEIAHAYKQICTYYQSKGTFPLVEEYTKNYHDFYESYGILTPLTEKENLAYDTILKNSNRNLQQAIKTLLNE